MTPDEVERAAIEAAAEEIARPYQQCWATRDSIQSIINGAVISEPFGDFRQNVAEADRRNRLDRASRAIAAYKAEIEKHNSGFRVRLDHAVHQFPDGTSRYEKVVLTEPLPQPQEQKP